MKLTIKKDIAAKIKNKQREKERIYKMYSTVSTVITKEEMHRLKKVLKNEDNELKLKDWAYGLALQLNNINAREYYNHYQKKMDEDLNEIIGWSNATIVYTLRYNHNCKFGAKRIQDFMTDYFVTYDMFKNREITPQTLIDQLKKDGIEIVFKNDSESE